MTIEASFTFSKLLDGFFSKLLDATEHGTRNDRKIFIMVDAVSQFCLPHRHRITSQTKAIKRSTKYRNAQRGQRIIDRNHKRWVYRCLKIDIKSALDSTDAPISPVARYSDWKNIITAR